MEGGKKITITKPTKEQLDSLGVFSWGIWECEASEFSWEYSDKETCYLLEGDVEVKTEWETVTFGAGDMVVFPKGLKCTWNIKKAVKKHYLFE